MTDRPSEHLTETNTNSWVNILYLKTQRNTTNYFPNNMKSPKERKCRE